MQHLLGGHWGAVPCPAPGRCPRQVAEGQNGAAISQRAPDTDTFSAGERVFYVAPGSGSRVSVLGSLGLTHNKVLPGPHHGHRTSASNWPS